MQVFPAKRGPSLGYLYTNGGAAWRVILHNEILHWDIDLLRENPENRGRNRISSIPLTVMSLDDDALVHLSSVVLLVLLRVVWMPAMGHIRRDEERSLDDSLKIVCVFGFRREELVDSLKGLWHDAREGTLGGLRTDFFVVEQSDHVDELAFVLALHQGDEGVERGVEVVQSGRRDVLVVHSEEDRGSGIRNVQIEIQNTVGIDTQIISNQIHKLRIVLFVDALLLFAFLDFLYFLCFLPFLCFRIDQLSDDLTGQNGSEVVFEVGLELVLIRCGCQMDGEIGHLQ